MTRLKTIRRKYRKKNGTRESFREALRKTRKSASYKDVPASVPEKPPAKVQQAETPQQEFMRRYKLTKQDFLSNGVINLEGRGLTVDQKQRIRGEWARINKQGDSTSSRSVDVSVPLGKPKPRSTHTPIVRPEGPDLGGYHGSRSEVYPRSAEGMYGVPKPPVKMPKGASQVYNGGKLLKSLRLKYRSKKKKGPHGEPHENAAAIRSDVQGRKKKERTRQRALEGLWHDKRRGWPHDPTERK